VFDVAGVKRILPFFSESSPESAYDGKADQVVCSVHGNRQHSRQKPAAAQDSFFSRFVERVDQVEVRLRFQDDGLIATVEIARAEPARK
jgi:hypothetical protein